MRRPPEELPAGGGCLVCIALSLLILVGGQMLHTALCGLCDALAALKH